ncbi:MAG: hypothetical protein GXY33_10640 [Phycisphaerae bacterium]|nr:hypothetical protein [Phycisphaerae bacterium]
MRRFRAFTLMELIVVVGIIAMLVAIIIPVIAQVHATGYRVTCTSNLHQIGVGLIVYADANHGSYPCIDPPLGNNQKVVATNDPQVSWRNLSPVCGYSSGIDDPFDSSIPVHKSVTAGIWLLCRNRNSPLPEKLFVCPAVPRKRGLEDPLEESDGSRRSAEYFSDFYVDHSAGPLVSYSFHNPWSPQWSVMGPNPGFVLGGDENNGLDPTAHAFKGDPENYRLDTTKANSLNHKSKGQNLLFADASVAFHTNPHAGMHGDNVYSAYRDLGGLSLSPHLQPGSKDINPAHIETDTVLIPLEEEALRGI